MVDGVLSRHVARATPSPYAKRWWTDKLATLRNSLSAARNSLTTIRRRGQSIAEAAASVKQARRLYMDEIERCKKRHWADFLDDRDNIWKAYAYSKAAKVTHGIPMLRHGDAQVTDDR